MADTRVYAKIQVDAGSMERVKRVTESLSALSQSVRRVADFLKEQATSHEEQDAIEMECRNFFEGLVGRFKAAAVEVLSRNVQVKIVDPKDELKVDPSPSPVRRRPSDIEDED